MLPFFPEPSIRPFYPALSLSLCWWLINIGWQSYHLFFLPGKEIIRLRIFFVHFSTKAHSQNHNSIHNYTNNTTELTHYNSCLITAAWKEKCDHCGVTAHIATPCLISEMEWHLSNFLLSKVNCTPKNVGWLQLPHVSCQTPTSVRNPQREICRCPGGPHTLLDYLITCGFNFAL